MIELTKDEIKKIIYVLENDIHDMKNQEKEYGEDDQLSEMIDDEENIIIKLNKLFEEEL